MEKFKAWALAHRCLFLVFLFFLLFLIAIFSLVVAVTSLPIESVGSDGFLGAVVFGESFYVIWAELFDLIFDKRKDGDA